MKSSARVIGDNLFKELAMNGIAKKITPPAKREVVLSVPPDVDKETLYLATSSGYLLKREVNVSDEDPDLKDLGH